MPHVRSQTIQSSSEPVRPWSTPDETRLPPIHPSISEVAVVVPVHDEEERIVASLRALDVASRSQALAVTAVIVLDSCTDDSERFVHDAAARYVSTSWVVTAATVRRASSARQHGLDHFVGRQKGDPGRIALLSTDADTVVPADWISFHVEQLDRGVDAVAGIVSLAADEIENLDVAIWHEDYATTFTEDGAHGHVHAANLAVRLDVLMAAGGFGHAERAEDIDLWRRLTALRTARLRADRRSVVATSSRVDGRVNGGFATALQQFRSARPPVAVSS